jgi:hypothetical protein
VNKHTITLTDEQFEALADAAEWVSRFLSGQIDAYTLPAELRFSLRYQDRNELIRGAMDNLKVQLFPELEKDAFYGVGFDTDDESIGRTRTVLYEVYRTMREYYTQQREESGEDVSYSVYAYPGLNFTGLPKPIIKPVDESGK